MNKKQLAQLFAKVCLNQKIFLPNSEVSKHLDNLQKEGILRISDEENVQEIIQDYLSEIKTLTV
jgi:hypothetical protein